jgi:anti-sigma regulatory factor (Ser/Thr protein kinase)
MSERPRQARSRDFPGTLEAASEAEAWLVNEFGDLGLGPDAEFAINLCVEELFINAVEHGQANRATISIWHNSDGARLEFVDDGEPFDPTGAPAKRISGPSHDFEIGGYGVGLMRTFSRRVSYCRADGRNRLVLEFDAGRSAGASPEALTAT